MNEKISILENETINPKELRAKKTLTVVVILAVVLFVVILAGVFLLAQPENQAVAAQVRDIFIILLAFEMFLVGIAAVILIIQLATLTNLLQNEIKPILNTTTDTVNTLKGTVRFVSDNLTEPVIQINESLASAKKLVDLLKIKK